MTPSGAGVATANAAVALEARGLAAVSTDEEGNPRRLRLSRVRGFRLREIARWMVRSDRNPHSAYAISARKVGGVSSVIKKW
jgi:hypothetical protein